MLSKLYFKLPKIMEDVRTPTLVPTNILMHKRGRAPPRLVHVLMCLLVQVLVSLALPTQLLIDRIPFYFIDEWNDHKNLSYEVESCQRKFTYEFNGA